MFAPTKVWRKWHVKINQGQKYVKLKFEVVVDERGRNKQGLTISQ